MRAASHSNAVLTAAISPMALSSVALGPNGAGQLLLQQNQSTAILDACTVRQ